MVVVASPQIAPFAIEWNNYDNKPFPRYFASQHSDAWIEELSADLATRFAQFLL